MHVKARTNGKNSAPARGKNFGIYVGAPNRDKHFQNARTQDARTTIEVVMDGVVRAFGLTDAFWRDCPEIRDSGKVIHTWLAARGSLEWPRGAPPRFTLTPLGGQRFELK